MSKRAAAIVFAFLVFLELIALGMLYYYIPTIRRPFEIIMGVIAGCSLLQLAAARSNAVRSVLLVLFLLTGTVFALEMADKYYEITRWFNAAQAAPLKTAQGGLTWRSGAIEEYFAARRKAREMGLAPEEAFVDRFAGDIFADRDKKTLVIDSSENSDGLLANVGLKPFRTVGLPLGYELTPDNVVRSFFVEKKSGQALFDGRITSGPAGERLTRGNPAADETYVFFGCSVTFGYGLSDDQTLPHYFSGEGGFANRVVNLALSGYGPNHALRDLELNYHLGKMGVDPAGVRGVFFGLIEGHNVRVVQPTRGSESPYYELNAAGRPEYRGGYMENMGGSRFGRLFSMLNKSRIFPKLREKFFFRGLEEERGEQWKITLAILVEMHRICLERYGVPLTVLYWNDNPVVIETLRAEGVNLLLASELLGRDWIERMAPVYCLFDYHPSAFLNQTLARPVYESMTRLGKTKEGSRQAGGGAGLVSPGDT